MVISPAFRSWRLSDVDMLKLSSLMNLSRQKMHDFIHFIPEKRSNKCSSFLLLTGPSSFTSSTKPSTLWSHLSFAFFVETNRCHVFVVVVLPFPHAGGFNRWFQLPPLTWIPKEQQKTTGDVSIETSTHNAVGFWCILESLIPPNYCNSAHTHTEIILPLVV